MGPNLGPGPQGAFVGPLAGDLAGPLVDGLIWDIKAGSSSSSQSARLGQGRGDRESRGAGRLRSSRGFLTLFFAFEGQGRGQIELVTFASLLVA